MRTSSGSVRIRVLEFNIRGEEHMGGPAENLAAARRYIKAIACGARGDEIAPFFATEAVVEIFPSRFFPNGSREGLAGVRAAADRGNKAMSLQKYEIKSALSSGDTVALEIVWTGTLALPFQSKPAGAHMRAHFAGFCNSRAARSSRNAITIATIPDVLRDCELSRTLFAQVPGSEEDRFSGASSSPGDPWRGREG